MLISSGSAVQPVFDAATRTDVAEAYLARPLGYVLLAPLSGVLDTLTLISARQHVALLLGVLVIFAADRALRGWLLGATRRQHLVATALLLGGLALVYLAAAVLPRPMASLTADDAHILRVDFHSHTRESHDGHQSVEQLRSWHASAGFDVAYVTDHASVAGAERGLVRNPNPVSGGTTLLQGIEVTWSGEHVTILNAERIYRGLLTDSKRDVDPRGLQLASLIPGREPVVIWNHPREVSRLNPATGPGTSGIRAVEIVNGAPGDMDALRRNRAAILALADRANLALTSGSDNHGWGRAAPGWTLLRVFGWRGLDPDALALRIERVLREGGREASRVVERRVADPGASRVAVAFSAVTVPARMLTTLSTDERVAWLVWTWLIAAGLWWSRRRRVTA